MKSDKNTNSSYVIEESIQKNCLFIKSEILKKEKLQDGSYIIEGIALPYDKFSRNGVKYRKPSIESTYKTFWGRPSLFNHNFDISIGHVEMTDLQAEGMGYKINLDGMDPFVANLVRKIDRGDITSVSIQVMYANETYDQATGMSEVDITEGIEISVVTIPGFADTTAKLAESLHNKFNNQKGGEKMADDPKDDPNNKPDENPNKEMVEAMSEMRSEMKAYHTQVLEGMAEIKELCKTKKHADDENDPPEDDKDKDPKETEALKNAKVNKEGLDAKLSKENNNAAEFAVKTEKHINSDDIKEAYKKI